MSRTSESGGLAAHVAVRRPFAWRALLAYLSIRAVAGVECVDRTVYHKVIHGPDGPTAIGVDFARVDSHGEVDVYASPDADLPDTVAAVSRLVDANADPLAIEAVLSEDAALRALVRQYRGIRIPGTTSPFELAVRAILGQQVSVAAARTLAGRLAAAHGHPLRVPGGSLRWAFPGAAELQSTADLTGLGIAPRRQAAIKELAERVLGGLVLRPGAAKHEDLLEIKGVGPWTASYISLRALADPDAIPAGDLGLRQAMSGGGPPVTSAALAMAAETWRPFRGYAAAMLWTTLLPGAGLRAVSE